MRTAAAAILLAAAAAPGCARHPVARDVLLVTLDTTRADHIGVYGAKDAETNTLDSLATDSALFENAVAPAPVTTPSHASMFTGLYPYRTGVRYNGVHVLASSHKTLAEVLGDAGFATGAVASSFAVAGRFGLAQGFDSYEDLFAGGPSERRDPMDERSASEAVDLGIRFWTAHKGKRRFLWVHLYSPHWEYRPPFPYSARFANRPYAGEIAYADHELGRLFDRLRKEGDWASTLVIVAGDHGEGLYEHGERWHSNLVYESTMHVPLLVKPPGRSRAKRIAEPVSLVDLFPTVLDYAGVPLPKDLDGVSLLPAIRSGRAGSRAIYLESMAGNLNYGWSPLHGVRRGRYKLIEGARPELYDVELDPREMDNLAPKEPRLVSDLGAELGSFLDVAKEAATAAETPVLDEEALAQLASLGYVGGGTAPTGERGKGKHPPEMIYLEQEMLRAQTAVQARDWATAREALDYILSEDPTNRFGLFFRAHVALTEKQLAEALSLAEAGARLYPDDADVQDLLAEVLSRIGRPSEAADLLARVAPGHPKDRRLRYHLVVALVEARRLAEADLAAAKLEAEFPGHYTGSLARAMVRAAEGKTSEAIAALSEAVDRGLKALGPIERSPDFASVRRDPAYQALKARIEGPASSATTS